MRTTFLAALFFTFSLAAISALFCASATAAPPAALGGHDVGELMERAEANYELSEMDAVILLDDRSVVIDADGAVRTTTHTIVWFSTELGLDTYADIRVPHNAGTSELEVIALRTWRDDTWWPHETRLSPTAVVETTPYALQSAHDYTTMRETMLLHDGVELPCIVETAYTITEGPDGLPGRDGLRMMQRPDPIVLGRFSLAVPRGAELRYALMNGAPEPESHVDASGNATFTWTTERVDRLPRPLTSDVRAHAPFVVWTTWESWDALGATVTSAVDGGAELTDSLRDSVAAVVEAAPFPFARAEAIASFIRETTRAVQYDDSFWRLRPRAAETTWQTAYGHRLDRAVLAAGMLREAGLRARPAYLSPGRGAIAADVPALSWFDGIVISVEGEGLLATFDPLSGRLSHGQTSFGGRTMWVAGAGGSPDVKSGAAGRRSDYELAVSIEPDEDAWSGTGLLSCSGALSAHASVVGLEGQAGDLLSRVARSVLDGATAEEVGLSELSENRVTAGFSLKLETPEPDDRGRTILVVGDPEGGVLASMPQDVHTYSEHRSSPVLLPGPVRQTVAFRLDPGEMEAVRVPEPASLTNDVGSFELSVERGGDGIITVTRTLAVGTERADSGGDDGTRPGAGYTGLEIRPEDWPSLRSLLLEESDPRHRTLMLR
jgi:hypothetical protein